jgi:hypothetical protein
MRAFEYVGKASANRLEQAGHGVRPFCRRRDMMQPAEYKHYFCQVCGDRKRSALTAPSMKIQWESVNDSMFRCGEWSDKGTIKPGPGCRAKATVELTGYGANPITPSASDARPVLHGSQPKTVGE